MTETNSSFVQCVLNIQERYKHRIKEANNYLTASIVNFPRYLAELEQLVDLHLPCIDDAKDWCSRLDNDRIIGLASADRAYDRRYTVYARIEDMRILRQQYGEFTLNEDGKDIFDQEKNLVKIPVTFTDVKFECIEVFFVREIPPDANCKIVTTTHTSTHTALVCDRPVVDD